MIKLHKIEAGTFKIDGGAMFGVVPKKVWQKRYPADEDNFCTVIMRCLLIDTGAHRILIDTGTGDKQLDYLQYYGFEEVAHFDVELAKLGYSAADITDVVFTHLHFDHCGGTTRYASDGNSVELVFPQATHWVGEAQWENFLNPNVREGDSYFTENMLPVFEAGRLKTITENQFICPEVELRLFHGHTVGQLVTLVSLGERKLVHPGDVIPISGNIPLAWVSAYDMYPLTSMEEKKQLLDEAIAENHVFFFGHDTYTECCTVKIQDEKYKVNHVYRLEELLG